QLVDAHDRVGRVVVDLVQARDVGDDGASACGEHEPVGGEGFLAARQVDGEFLVAGEAAFAFVDGDVGVVVVFGAVFASACGDGVDAAEDAVADVAPAHSVEGFVDAEPRRRGRGGGQVGGVDEHRRRDDGAVEARAAE